LSCGYEEFEEGAFYAMLNMGMLFLILVLQVAYVSLLSVRMILMIKGFRYWAALISAFEIGFYFIGFKLVLDSLDNPLNLLVYCASYGLGILVGTKIEERLALGHVTVQVVVNGSCYSHLVKALRDKGYGVTGWAAEGLEGPRWIMWIVTTRKKQSSLYRDILAIEPQAFIVSFEPNYYHGGFLLKRRRRHQPVALSGQTPYPR
jgi:uncharacterized protein YebE (UPF0316 family)